MRFVLFTAIFLVAIFVKVHTVNSEQTKCDVNDHIKADQCTTVLLVFGDKKRRPQGWPTTLAEYETTCQTFREKLSCMKDYGKKCGNAFTKQIVGILVRGINTQIKLFCGPKVNRAQMLKHTGCGNSDLPHDHNCVFQYVSTAKGIMSLPVDKRMAQTCCSFYTFKSCILGRMEKSRLCSKDDINLYKKVLNGVVGDALELACSSFKEGSTICIEQDKQAEAIKTSKGNFHSPLIPLMNVLNSF